MKSNEVLKLLKITRPTLCKYVKTGRLKAVMQPNGLYNYDEESVFKLINKDFVRVNAIYCRVSTPKQKNDLYNQEEVITSFCMQNGIIVHKKYKDVGSGINFDRKEFQEMLNDVVNYRISKIYITYKDRLSRISFNMFKNLFKQFNCEIVVINETEDEKLIEKEIFKEIIDLIHCFSMKVYSSRRKDKLKMIQKDLELEDEVSI
jgi:predicted site-specific integrase-resolvase